MTNHKLTPNQLRVMKWISEFDFDRAYYTAGIARSVNLTERATRRALRQLDRLGLLELIPCFDDDGRMAGRGYTLTVKGVFWAREYMKETPR